MLCIYQHQRDVLPMLTKQIFGMVANCIGMCRARCCVTFPNTGEGQDPDLPLAVAPSGEIECCANCGAYTTMCSHHLVPLYPRRFLSSQTTSRDPTNAYTRKMWYSQKLYWVTSLQCKILLFGSLHVDERSCCSFCHSSNKVSRKTCKMRGL